MADSKTTKADDKKSTEPSATKKLVIKAALESGVAESAASLIADKLEKDGYHVSKSEPKVATTGPELRVQPKS